MPIRLMHSDDCGPIAGVLNHAIEHGVAHFGTEPTSTELVREDWETTRERFPWIVASADDGSFAGFAKASSWKTRKAYDWTVESGIYLVEGAQGRGLGRTLYRRLFEVLAAQGYRVVLAGVSVPNPGSERLHESMGMTAVGDIAPAGYKHGRWVSVRIYQKQLGALSDHEPPGPIRGVRGVWDEIEARKQVNS